MKTETHSPSAQRVEISGTPDIGQAKPGLDAREPGAQRLGRGKLRSTPDTEGRIEGRRLDRATIYQGRLGAKGLDQPTGIPEKIGDKVAELCSGLSG